MTRYFYPASRAHHAKCMAIDFGMIFITPEDEEYQEETYTADNLEMAFEVHGAEKVYVHPDSLHLLDTKRGDWLSIGREMVRCCRVDQAGSSLIIPIIWYEGEEYLAQPKTPVVQRNGIAFHWPESESA